MPLQNPTTGNESQFKPILPTDKNPATYSGLTFDLFKEQLLSKNPTNSDVNKLYSTVSSNVIISQFIPKTYTDKKSDTDGEYSTKNPTNPKSVAAGTFKGLVDAGKIQSQFFPQYFGTGVASVDMELKNIYLNAKSNLIANSKILTYASNIGNLPKNSSHATNIIIDKELTNKQSKWAKAASFVGLNLSGTGTAQYSTLNLSQLYNPEGLEYPDFRARRRTLLEKAIDLDIDKTELPATSTLRLLHGQASDERGGQYYALNYKRTGVYSNINLNKTYGFGEQGTPGRAIRQDFTRISDIDTEHGDSTYTFRGDTITATGPASDTYNNTAFYNTDLIKFFFTGPNANVAGGEDAVMVFRAIITSMQDTHSPQWTPQQMIGRADPNWHYSSYSRELSLDFTVYASDRDEMKPIWQKLNMLAGYTTPSYGEVAPKGPWMRITIGDLFIQQPAIINTLSYTMHDSDTTWEINVEQDPYMNQLPHKVSVSIGFNLITDYLPEQFGRFYSLNEGSDYDWLQNTTYISNTITTEFDPNNIVVESSPVITSAATNDNLTMVPGLNSNNSSFGSFT